MKEQRTNNLPISKQQWLTFRNEKFISTLFGDEPIIIEDFSFEIKGLEYGWLDMTFKTEGQKPFFMSASDVYPPFPALRAWLEDLVYFTKNPSKSIVVDCENYKVLFSYVYLGIVETDGIFEPVALIQMEDDIPKEEQKSYFGYSLMLVAPIRTFVSKVYYTLKDYMYSNRRAFSKNWSHPKGGDFDIRKLMRTFVSKDIEKVIKMMNDHTQDLGHWPLIQIKSNYHLSHLLKESTIIQNQQTIIMDPMHMYPGDGYNPNQQTFILMWNPAYSSVTMDYHLYCIEHFYDEPFDWSVYEWEKAHEGDRFYLVRVGEDKTGIVMSGVFTSEPYVGDDWNKSRGSKQIHYMDMQPNFIINPDTMPIITTAQLQEAIPDFEWRRGHSGTLLTENQAQRLEKLFAEYLPTVIDKADGKNLDIL